MVCVRSDVTKSRILSSVFSFDLSGHVDIFLMGVPYLDYLVEVPRPNEATSSKSMLSLSSFPSISVISVIIFVKLYAKVNKTLCYQLQILPFQVPSAQRGG